MSSRRLGLQGPSGGARANRGHREGAHDEDATTSPPAPNIFLSRSPAARASGARMMYEESDSFRRQAGRACELLRLISTGSALVNRVHWRHGSAAEAESTPYPTRILSRRTLREIAASLADDQP